MTVHACFISLLHIFFERVRRDSNDRDPSHRSVQSPDRLRRFIAVHHRHLHVHQYGVVQVSVCFFKDVYRFAAVRRHIDSEALVLKQQLGYLAVDLHVFHQKEASSFRSALVAGCVIETGAVCPGLCSPLLRDRQSEIDYHFRAASRLGIDHDPAAHGVDNALADRHSKACALDAADRRSALSRKSFEDLLRELLRHSDARVLDTYLVVAAAASAFRCLSDPDRDAASFGRELESIAEQVQYDSQEAVPVDHDHPVIHITDIESVADLFLIHLPAEHIEGGADRIYDVGAFGSELHFSGLDPAHLKHVVDQRQKMVAGNIYFLNVLSQRRARFFLLGQMRVSDDGVHRRPDVMRHVEKELAGRMAALLSLDLFPFQTFMPFAQVILDIQHYRKTGHNDHDRQYTASVKPARHLIHRFRNREALQEPHHHRVQEHREQDGSRHRDPHVFGQRIVIDSPQIEYETEQTPQRQKEESVMIHRFYRSEPRYQLHRREGYADHRADGSRQGYSPFAGRFVQPVSRC